MYTFLIIIHAICSILLVAVVLFQVGRGRGMMGFLGSGMAETLFGSRAGDVLTKSTTVIATLFMITSLSLAYVSLKKTGSITKGIKPRQGLVPREARPGEVVPPGEDKFVEKGAELVGKAKDKLLEKIPILGVKKEKPVREVQKPEPKPTETTKSKIRYDEKGNKIVEEFKYDSSGRLIGHREVTYDRFDKVLSEKELPLVEEISSTESPS